MLIGIICALAALGAAGVCLKTASFCTLQWLWVLPVSFVGGILLLAALVFAVVYTACAFVDPDKERDEENKFFRLMIKLLAPAILTVARARVHTRGLEQAPKSGRFLLVCNHLHDADPVILMRYFPDSQLAFVGKRETKTMFLVGKIMSQLLCQFINRENDREALKTILRCIQLLKEDKVSIGIFPEGYINKDRKFHHLRPGVFKIAQKANVPIVVCTMTNTENIIKNFLKLRPTDIDLHLLEVIPVEFMEGKTAVDISNYVHSIMAEDLGEAYRPAEENA